MTPDDRWPDADLDERAFVREFDGSIAALEDQTRGCPPLRLLLAADAGVLPETAASEVASHRRACASCEAMLRDAHAAELGEPVDADVRRLRSIVGRGAEHLTSRSSWWSRGPAWAAAASVVAFLGMGAWVARLSNENAQLRTAPVGTKSGTPDGVAINVALIDLEPIDALRGTGVATVQVSASSRLVVLVLATNAQGDGPDYGAEIRDSSGRVAWSGAGLRASDLGTVTLVVPRPLMPLGNVAVRLFRGAPQTADLAHEYAVRLEGAP